MRLISASYPGPLKLSATADYNPEATFRWEQAMRRATGCGCQPDYLVGAIAVVFGDREFMEAL